MTPPTVNTQVRGPFASMQARSEPGPESFRLLTLMTAPPRPPCALRPKPSAPGKASGAAVAGGVQDGRTAAKAISSRAVLMDTPTSVSSAAAVPPPPRSAGRRQDPSASHPEPNWLSRLQTYRGTSHTLLHSHPTTHSPHPHNPPP